MTRRALLAWSWTLVILFLCWLPRFYLPANERTPRPFFVPNFDKLVHLGIFAVWGYLWMRVRPSADRPRWVFAGGVALAIISELVQELPIVGRDATFMDGVADVVGLVLGISAFLLARKLIGQKAVRPEV